MALRTVSDSSIDRQVTDRAPAADDCSRARPDVAPGATATRAADAPSRDVAVRPRARNGAVRILLVYADSEFGRAMRDRLVRDAHVVDLVCADSANRDVLDGESCDLVIVDIDTSGLGGYDVLVRWRSRGIRVPVIVVSAGNTVGDRIRALDAGADDYLEKPSDLDELAARVRALVRRCVDAAYTRLKCGKLTLDVGCHRAWLDGEPLELRRRELFLLETLVLNAGRVVSKEQLADALFGSDGAGSPNAVQIHVHRLRKKLRPAGLSIATLRGIGYLLDADRRPARD